MGFEVTGTPWLKMMAGPKNGAPVLRRYLRLEGRIVTNLGRILSHAHTLRQSEDETSDARILADQSVRDDLVERCIALIELDGEEGVL